METKNLWDSYRVELYFYFTIVNCYLLTLSDKHHQASDGLSLSEDSCWPSVGHWWSTSSLLYYPCLYHLPAKPQDQLPSGRVSPDLKVPCLYQLQANISETKRSAVLREFLQTCLSALDYAGPFNIKARCLVPCLRFFTQ